MHHNCLVRIDNVGFILDKIKKKNGRKIVIILKNNLLKILKLNFWFLNFFLKSIIHTAFTYCKINLIERPFSHIISIVTFIIIFCFLEWIKYI